MHTERRLYQYFIQITRVCVRLSVCLCVTEVGGTSGNKVQCYGGPGGRAKRRYQCDDVYATVDDVYVTVDDDNATVDDVYATVDDVYATVDDDNATVDDV